MLLPQRCPACGAAFDGADALLVCPSCSALVPPHPQATPFARLGLPQPRFVVDEKALEATWLQRSRLVHPDKAARKSPAERRFAVEQTAALNDAWRLLRVPFDRAQWLLQRAGVAEPKLPQALLVSFMEAREEAEDGGPDAKAAVVARARARFDVVVADVAARLAVVDAEAGGYDRASPALQKVAADLAEAKTLARLVDDLGGGKLIASLDGR
jgi:molecular chaperone HscB